MPLSNPSGRLALVIRELIDRRGMKQKALAKQIGMAESSLSQILNARARPRQISITRMMQVLCTSPDEEQMLIAAYDQAEAANLPLRPGNPERPIGEDEIERVRRYMEVKSMSVAFEQDVEKILAELAFSFEHPYRHDPFICDFYIPGPPRIALDCKFNVNRDWDRTVAATKIFFDHLPVDDVLIVIPYENEVSRASMSDLEEHGGSVVVVSELSKTIRTLMKGPKHG